MFLPVWFCSSRSPCLLQSRTCVHHGNMMYSVSSDLLVEMSCCCSISYYSRRAIIYDWDKVWIKTPSRLFCSETDVTHLMYITPRQLCRGLVLSFPPPLFQVWFAGFTVRAALTKKLRRFLLATSISRSTFQSYQQSFWTLLLRVQIPGPRREPLLLYFDGG